MTTNVQKMIINELLDIGYNIKYRGTQLLAEAICIAEAASIVTDDGKIFE